MDNEKISLVHVGKKEFDKIVKENGGFGCNNENLKLNLALGEATFDKRREDDSITRYVYKK